MNKKLKPGRKAGSCTIFFSCLLIMAGFTHKKEKTTVEDKPVFNVSKKKQQLKLVLMPGPNEDRDGDGIVDGIDVDDDNDGIADLQESPTGLDPFGDDNGNSILNYQDNTMPGWVDVNGDNIDDRYDMDRDGIINSYDLDSDGDGISDVIEAGLPDIDDNAQVDGSIGGNGLGTSVPAGFVPLNTDGDLVPNFLDIDADGDGITDNVEAQLTNKYVLPLGTDTDQDGIDDAYDRDNSLFHNNQGIIPLNTGADATPDYIDDDTDDDGRPDLIEGHDGNLDGVADYTPTGIDTDGDGLDDAFDLDNTGPNSKNEGMNQVPFPPFFDSNPPANPPAPLGCRGPLQRNDPVNDLDRSWRDFDTFLLPLILVRFIAEKQNDNIVLNWQSENESNFREYVLERSKDGSNFKALANIPGKGGWQASYSYTDNLGEQAGKVYYRLKQVDNNDHFVYSRILSVTAGKIKGMVLGLAPNPASGNVTLNIASDRKRNITITVFDHLGRGLITQRTGIGSGDNIIPLSQANTLRSGAYTVMITDGEQKQSQKLLVQK